MLLASIIKAEKGRVSRLPYREEFLRDGSDWLHGGVVSALADIAGDYAVMSRPRPACPPSTCGWTTCARRGGAT
jgi:acyl-coenzyme A thioesterase PaaI-like protein